MEFGQTQQRQPEPSKVHKTLKEPRRENSRATSYDKIRSRETSSAAKRNSNPKNLMKMEQRRSHRTIRRSLLAKPQNKASEEQFGTKKEKNNKTTTQYPHYEFSMGKHSPRFQKAARILHTASGDHFHIERSRNSMSRMTSHNLRE